MPIRLYAYRTSLHATVHATGKDNGSISNYAGKLRNIAAMKPTKVDVFYSLSELLYIN